MNPYQTLGIHPKADPAVVRCAYLAMAQKNHPDKGGDAATMAAVTEAWEALKSPLSRAKLDTALALKKAATPACKKCGGRGLFVPKKGFTPLPAVVCPKCGGTGL